MTDGASINVQAKPTARTFDALRPSLSTGDFTADMDTITADSDTHTTDEK